MATIRTKFRSSSAEGREGALYYQVIHNRVVRQISTGYKLFASEWDQRSEAVIPCQHPAGMERDNNVVYQIVGQPLGVFYLPHCKGLKENELGGYSYDIDTMKLLLDRCIRFYDRQFITRENANNDLLARFELLLNNYYHSALPTSKGIPTVQYCADQLCLSTNYFSDLVKKETGMSAIKHIQQKIMDIAKERIMNT